MEPPRSRTNNDAVPSSSPAFATPAHPFDPAQRTIIPPVFRPVIPTVLPVQLPPASLRPLAFRTFTKKYNLTLSSSALQALSTFVGRHCGSAWREAGTAEKLLEEVAKAWKKASGPLIVDDGPQLKSILKLLEGCMSGGRVIQAKIGLNRQSSSFSFSGNGVTDTNADENGDENRPPLLNHSSSFGLSGLDVAADGDGSETQQDEATDARGWIKIVDAYTQPRFTYNMRRKHFERVTTAPSLLPPPNNKSVLFRDRYNLIHQRILRNPAFQAPSVNTRKLSRVDSVTQLQNFRITPIANLLGRSGSTHLLLGLLAVTPTGSLALHDLTGGITLDLDYARPVEDKRASEAPWTFPGCIVLIEGVYQEEFSGAGSSGLGGGGGIGGMIGGKFVGLTIGNPPCERRSTTLGIQFGSRDDGQDGTSAGAGFGWTDFLGIGSEKATGTRMKRLETKLLGNEEGEAATKLVILGEVHLDDPDCIDALREVLKRYTVEPSTASPLAFVMTGNFVSHASLSRTGGGRGGSIEYKEYLDGLASLLGEFPQSLRNSKWVFVPGDNDPWPSAFSAGSSTPIPRKGVPALFTNRIKTAFAHAKTDGPLPRKAAHNGEAIWTTNPSRVTLFGPAHEIVVFRDDISSRMQRTAINYGRAARQEAAEKQQQEQNAAEVNDDVIMSDVLPEEIHHDSATETVEPSIREAELDYATRIGRKMILSLLPQAHLSPFPLSIRPVHWDFGSALSIYPLPHTLILADADAPAFAITYEGCHVMNPSRFLKSVGKRKKITWVEYDGLSKRGEIRTLWQ